MAKLSHITSADEIGIELEFVEQLHAGYPSPAADNTGERIDMVREMTPHPETTFYAQVSGESMLDAGLQDGDIVVIDKSLEPHNGDYIVAAIDGEFTLKEFRYQPGDDHAYLVPHNSEFQPIKVDASNNFSVWGVVTHCIHKFR